MTSALLIFLTIFSSLHLIHMLILLIGLTESRGNTHLPQVSVIIAARNEAEHLPLLIEALAQQSHPKFEVLIINDRSEDDTVKILEKLKTYSWLKIINITSLPQGWNGKKHALYQGIKRATNPILVFTDADCLPNSNKWLEEISSNFDPNVDVVLGYSPYEQSKGLMNHLIQFETSITALQYLGSASIGYPYMAVGRNWAIRKESYPIEYLKSISNLIGGDDDLIAQHILNKENCRISFSRESQVMSKAQKSWGALIRQKVRHLAIGKYYSKKSKTLAGLFSFSYAISWLIFLVLIVSQQWSTALLIYGIRSLSFYIIFIQLGQKMDTNFSKWALPLIDFCYPLWYTYLGVRSLAAKQIEWKPESSFLIKH